MLLEALLPIQRFGGNGLEAIAGSIVRYFRTIAYFVRAETILIAAVAHARRRPGYWRDRLDG